MNKKNSIRDIVSNDDSAEMKLIRETFEETGVRVLSSEERDEVAKYIYKELEVADDFWVFAYGSLIWNPTLNYTEMRKAILPGWQRSFCFNILAGRATKDKPGLMLGLVPGGECSGVAYKIDSTDLVSEVEYFCKREILTDIYIPSILEIDTDDGVIKCLALVGNSTNPRYVNLDLHNTAQKIAKAEGIFGTNRDYLFETYNHLKTLGFNDNYLKELVTLVKDLSSSN